MLERLEKRDGGVICEVLVEIIIDLDHGSVGTGTEALDFGKGEEAVLGRLAVVDSENVLAGLHDGVAVPQHAGCLGFVSGVGARRMLLLLTVVQTWTW